MEYARGICASIAKEMGAPEQVLSRRERGRYSIVPYRTTHNTGGTVFGEDPRTSALNKHLQSWDVPMYSWWVRACFRRTRDTIQPGRWARWRIDSPIRSRIGYLKRPERLVNG